MRLTCFCGPYWGSFDVWTWKLTPQPSRAALWLNERPTFKCRTAQQTVSHTSVPHQRHDPQRARSGSTANYREIVNPRKSHYDSDLMQAQQVSKPDLSVLKIDRQRAKRSSRKWRRWVWAVLLIALLVIGISVMTGQFGPLSAKPVRVAVAARRTWSGAEPVLTASGYIIARHQVEVGSKITGRIVALLVDEGDQVRQGQLIARLDDQEIRAQLQQAQANVAAAKARLAELEAGSRPQEIERAKAEKERLLADMNNAEINWQRVRQLVNDGVLQQQALDDARARLEMAQKAYQAAVENYELTRLGPRQEQIELARAQWRQAEAELAYVQAQLDNTLIRAPVGGTVLDRYADLGEMVTTGFTSDRGAKQALVSIADLRDLQVEMDITEADIAKVALNQPVTIIPDAYTDRRYNGIVEYIADVADRQKATIQVKVKVLNPDAFLRPDMGAKVTFFPMGTAPSVASAGVFVPASAIIDQHGRPSVFVVKDDKAMLQPVRLGEQADGYVNIRDGLQGGERVIIGGHENLKDGDKISVQS